MWAIARVDLGLSDEDFTQLTPRRLRALIKRHNRIESAREERADYRAALIMYYIAAGGFRQFSPEPTVELMLSHFKLTEEQTIQDMFAKARAINAAIGGREV